MSRPRPQILTLRYHPHRVVGWREHPEPEAEPTTTYWVDPTIRFCGGGLEDVLGLAVGGRQIRLRVAAKQRRRAREVALGHLASADLASGVQSSTLNGQAPMWATLPRIRVLLTRVLGRPPVVGDVVWVEVLP